MRCDQHLVTPLAIISSLQLGFSIHLSGAGVCFMDFMINDFGSLVFTMFDNEAIAFGYGATLYPTGLLP